MGKAMAAVVAVALAAAVAAPLAEAAKGSRYRTPGYRGIREAPPTRPQEPPPSFQVGTGAKPQVLVDAAGTGHVVWKEHRDPNADVLAYCRIKRGATACDNPPATRELVPQQPGAEPTFNDDTSTPRVLSTGDELVLLTGRYPNVQPSPDGGTSDDNTYLFLSSDGGNSFPDPALVGTQQPSGTPTVFGPAGSPRIGLVSDTETGGAFFQAIAPGRFTRARASLGGIGYESTAAAVGTSVMVAYTDLSSTIHLRTWTGQGDVHDAATWTETLLPGAGSGRETRPRLAGGPRGVFMMYRDAEGRHLVRRVFPGPLGAPVVVETARNWTQGELTQDAGGNLRATFVESLFGEIGTRTSTDGGRRWSARQVLMRAPQGGRIELGRGQGAAFDGGGFVVAQQVGERGMGPIRVVPVGNQGPTGRPGLGNLAGGGGDPSIVSTCRRVKFAAVSIVAQEGCLLQAESGDGVRVSEGVLRLNGLEIVPDPDVKIVMDPRRRTLDTTGNVTVQARAPGVAPVVLYYGRLNLALDAEGGLALGAAAGARASGGGAGLGTCTGRRLAGLDASPVSVVKGFPIKGKIEVLLSGESACIPVALELPRAFGGVRGQAILRTDNERGLRLESLRIEVKQAAIGPLTLEDLLITYEAARDQWDGNATLGIPPQPGGAKLKAGVQFREGRFTRGRLGVQFVYPGIVLDPFAASYWTYAELGFALDPLELSGRADFGVLPIPPSFYAFSVDGTLTVRFAGDVQFIYQGNGRLIDIPVASQRVTVSTSGLATAEANVGIGLFGVRVSGGLNAFADMRSRRFGGKVRGEVCIPAFCDEAEAVISTKGFGACVSKSTPVGTARGGFGYAWGEGLDGFDLMGPTSCDLGPWTEPQPPGPRAAAAVQSFTVERGARTANVRVRGAGDTVPSVTLVSPTGERIAPSPAEAPTTKALSFAHPARGTLYLGLVDPAPGTWRVEANPGSADLVALEQAAELPTPEVSGRLGGSGRARTLTYRATTGNGLATTFFERSARGQRLLGAARGPRGTLRFAPGPGPAGRREIVALVERNGMPRLERVLATYRAPGPARPARVAGVRVTRRGRTLVIAWRGAGGAATYVVRVELGDGRRLTRIVSGKARSVRVPGVGRRVSAKVSVAGRSAQGVNGSAGRARG